MKEIPNATWFDPCKTKAFAGCYAIYINDFLAYIGQSSNVVKRVAQHSFRPGIVNDLVTPWGVFENGHVHFAGIRCDDLAERLKLERDLIGEFGPAYNIMGTSRKAQRDDENRTYNLRQSHFEWMFSVECRLLKSVSERWFFHCLRTLCENYRRGAEPRPISISYLSTVSRLHKRTIKRIIDVYGIQTTQVHEEPHVVYGEYRG